MATIVTYDHLRSKKKPVTKWVWLCLDTEIKEEHEEARRRLNEANVKARSQRTPQTESLVASAQAEVDELEERVREASVKFVFKSMGRKKFDALVAEHPPTPAQKKTGTPDRPVDFNPDTFPQVLVAACIVEPQLTPENVQEIWNDDNWSDLDLAALFNTALLANQSNSVVRLGNG